MLQTFVKWEGASSTSSSPRNCTQTSVKFRDFLEQIFTRSEPITFKLGKFPNFKPLFPAGSIDPIRLLIVFSKSLKKSGKGLSPDRNREVV